MKLYTQSITACWHCPNYTEIPHSLDVKCQANGRSVIIPKDFNVFGNVLQDCPLPDADPNSNNY